MHSFFIVCHFHYFLNRASKDNMEFLKILNTIVTSRKDFFKLAIVMFGLSLR